MKKVRNYLNLHWKRIVENNIKIPLHKICISEEYKTIEVRDTNFLKEIETVFTDKQVQDFGHELGTPSVYTEIPDENYEDINIFKELDSSTTTHMACSDMSSNEAGNSSRNSQKSSSYITKEAHAIFLILGDSQELSMYDKRKDLFKK